MSLGQRVTKRFLLFFSVILMFSILNASEDVLGWRNTKWGLNEQEILNLFPKEAIKLKQAINYDDFYAPIAILNYEIAGDQYDVHFLFNRKTDKLEGINILPVEKKPESLRTMFFQLEQLLTEKYGTPSLRQEDKKINQTKIFWQYPSTVIKLSLFEIKIIDSSILGIYYRMPSKDLK